MIRKIICGVINTISVLVIAAAIVILCMVLFTEPGKPPNIFGFTMLRITTGSMEPTYTACSKKNRSKRNHGGGCNLLLLN